MIHLMYLLHPMTWSSLATSIDCTPTTEGTLRFSIKKEVTHYHLSIACIQQKNKNFNSQDVEISEEDHKRFLASHKELLKLSWVLTCSLINKKTAKRFS